MIIGIVILQLQELTLQDTNVSFVLIFLQERKEITICCSVAFPLLIMCTGSFVCLCHIEFEKEKFPKCSAN